jgi:hypothetical protein
MAQGGGAGRWGPYQAAGYAMYLLMRDGQVSASYLAELAHWSIKRVQYMLYSMSPRLPIYSDADGPEADEPADVPMAAPVEPLRADVWYLCAGAEWETEEDEVPATSWPRGVLKCGHEPDAAG